MQAIICGQHFSFSDRSLVVSKSVGVYEIEFVFDSAWADWNKTAVFEGSGQTIEKVIVEGKAGIPWEVLQTDGPLKIGVYGTKGDGSIMPTVWGDKVIIKRGTPTGSTGTEPTPSIYAQILETANNAKETADEAYERAVTAQDSASASAESAATSAASASASAENASASASSASESASSASASAVTASTSADSASQSAAAAQVSASNASASETNASASETAAQASAGSASQSAANAATSAGSAAASASSATASASAAKTSETNAQTSASAAASSASGASANASAAAASAEAAQNSASAAQTAQTEAENAAGSVSALAAQIDTNTADISEIKAALTKYDDIARIIKITSTTTTLGDIATILGQVNTVGDHIFFDMSALGVMMYLCTIYIDTANNVYKVFDLVSGRYAEGTYDATILLTMATAQANGLAVQSQIDFLQNEIDELGGKSVIKNLDALGDMIQAGTSTDIISPGDTTDFNWIESVLGTTTNGLTVTCFDMDKFINGVGEAEESTYLFVYDGTNWTYENEVIVLSDFGLSLGGAPATGEVMTIRTTVNAVNYTFVGYDDFTPVDSNIAHNWCMEQTYAPLTKAYNTYESLFCVQEGKSIAAGKWYLPMHSYLKGKTFNCCFEIEEAIGGATKVQARSTGYDYITCTDATGASISNTYKPKALNFILYGTATAAGSNASVICLSDAEVESGGYTNMNTLNTDADDPVFVPGDFDKSALGNNCWPASNLRQWLGDDAAGDTFAPSYDNNCAASYVRGNGYLWGLDPRVKKLIQYAQIKWTSGYGNHDIESYQPATGTAPASDAPIFYDRSGEPGNWTYTALDPQPAAGDDVSGYFVHLSGFTQGQTYVSEDRVFLLSMKEMSFNIQTNEGNATDLYSEYTNGVLDNNAVASRAKYNKAGGTLNSYRWSRSAISGSAFNSRLVTSTGSGSSNGAVSANYYAPAFIIGKSGIAA